MASDTLACQDWSQHGVAGLSWGVWGGNGDMDVRQLRHHSDSLFLEIINITPSVSAVRPPHAPCGSPVCCPCASSASWRLPSDVVSGSSLFELGFELGFISRRYKYLFPMTTDDNAVFFLFFLIIPPLCPCLHHANWRLQSDSCLFDLGFDPRLQGSPDDDYTQLDYCEQAASSLNARLNTGVAFM